MRLWTSCLEASPHRYTKEPCTNNNVIHKFSLLLYGYGFRCAAPSGLCRSGSGGLRRRLCCPHCCLDREVCCLRPNKNQGAGEHASKSLQLNSIKPCSAVMTKLCLSFQRTTSEDNALDALSETLKDIKPAPQPAPVPSKDLVKVASALQDHGYYRKEYLILQDIVLFNCYRRKKLLKQRWLRRERETTRCRQSIEPQRKNGR